MPIYRVNRQVSEFTGTSQVLCFLANLSSARLNAHHEGRFRVSLRVFENKALVRNKRERNWSSFHWVADLFRMTLRNMPATRLLVR